MDPELLSILDLDALQPAKSILLLALKRYESDDLFQQLLSVDSILDVLKDSIPKLREDEYKVPFDPIRYRHSCQQLDDVYKFLSKFKKVQMIVREKFNLRARKLLRDGGTPRFPNNFPDEVLLRIVNCFQRSLDGDKFRFEEDFMGSKMTTIKNIRLTCRRLCEISSHLLVPCIRISPSLSSLEHLDQVASHPTISQGLRLFVVDMPDLRATSSSAQDLQGFLHFSKSLHWRLVSIIEEYDSDNCTDRMIDFLKIAEKVRTVLEDIKQFSPSGAVMKSAPDLNDLDSLNMSQLSLRLLLLLEHDRIRELYLEQVDVLRSGRFTRSVAAAAARSRSRVCLHISNTWDGESEDLNDRFGLWKALEDPGLVLDFEFVIRSTRMHMGHKWQTGGFGQNCQYLHSVIYELPLAMCAAGAVLDRFMVEISGRSTPPFPTFNIPQEQIFAAQRASKSLRLETLNFQMSGFRGRTSLSSYLSALIDPRIIQSLSLDLSSIKDFSVDPPAHLDAVGPLRVSGPWDRLRTLTLKDYSVHLNELEKLLGVLQPYVDLILERVTLLSGTWAEALDCIRPMAGEESDVIDPQGSELEFMSEDDREAIFYNEYAVSPATKYIRGFHDMGNPLREEDEGLGELGEP